MKRLSSVFVMLFVMIGTCYRIQASVLTVSRNSSSGISCDYLDANYTGTLSDGSILGFYLSGSSSYFLGAISSASSIEVPDSVLISASGNFKVVSYCGYYGYNLDFREATSLTMLILPSTITNIHGDITSQIENLHLKSTTPPHLYNRSSISKSTTVWVPQSAISSYDKETNNSGSYWYGITVHQEGWVKNTVTVTVNSPGSFAQVLLGQVGQWSDVDELTVIGELNETDLSYLSRLKYVTKIDLTQTNIKTITGCTGLSRLRTILLPSTVCEVQDKAFSGCSALNDISLPNATSIGDGAFSSCSSLASVSLPAATSIGYNAFSYCSSLASVSLPAATSIGNNAFGSCNILASVSLPAATSIGSEAFNSCRSLASVSLPAATSIGNESFEYCSSLASVSLPAATSIGWYAFQDCSSLASVSLPAATSIGYGAFSYCSSLASVSLPASLLSLGDMAFYSCSKLEDVYCYAASPLNTSAFHNAASSATLHVPAFSVSAYILHDDWYTFNEIVAIEGNIDNVNIVSDLIITELKGLAEKADLSVLSSYDYYGSICYSGHLTVSVSEKWSLGNYVQSQANDYTTSWNSTTDSYDYFYYCSTTIPYYEMTADSVTVKYSARTNKWNFISFPFDVNVSDITYPEGTLWVIRRYSGDDRAKMTGNTWQNMTDGMTLKAGQGYILHCTDSESGSSSSTTIEFTFKAIDNSNKNNIFAYQDVTTSLSSYAADFAHNRSWNLVGNPYPCFFDSRSIEHDGVITAWNGYGYTAYSLLDDDYILRPHEAFFVQCPDDATGMKFKADGRTHKYLNSDDMSYTKASSVAGAGQRSVYNLTLTGAGYTDKTRVAINENAKTDYEINCDAVKFMSSNTSVPQLYILENGQKMAIDERPLADGIIALGVYIGEAGEYTIASSGDQSDDVILTDNSTGKSINLRSDTYTFSASEGTSDSRFTINIGGVTGIESVQSSEVPNTEVYNLNGQQLSKPQGGINIINGTKTLVR